MKWLTPFYSLIRILFWSGLVLVAFGILGGSLLVFHTAADLPKLPEDLNRMIETPQSLVYASTGQVILRLGERKSVPLSQVSRDFINAILATEDHLFFRHHGVNKLRTLKGLYITLVRPGRVEGASTITQQLAKNMFFSFEQSFARKFKELLVALQIEAANSKEAILEAYINQIHFGAGAQGIEKAAYTFFGKSALDLTLPEAALLAGLPKSPTAYNPFRHMDRALKRRELVLNRMAATGFITPEEARIASAQTPVLHHKQKDSRSGSYFVDALIRELVQEYGENVVYHGGIRVYATVDPNLQALARTSLEKGLNRLDGLLGIREESSVRPQGALVAVDTATGAVKALVGGRNYYESEFNRAVDARRQAGSGFKPFTYYAAFESKGLHPGTVMTDRPVTVPVTGAPDWTPRNFERTFQGNMVLKRALTRSVNTIAAQLVEMTGPSAVSETARRCGVKSPLRDVFSIALGTSGVTPLEMASAYTVFANLGVRHAPFLFWRVEDAFGRVLQERIVRDEQVLDPALAFQITDMMTSVVDNGSGRSIRKLGFTRACAGKTGTSDNYTDAWFTGFTPSLCTSVWTGFDKKRQLKDERGVGITGGRGAAPIWADFMSQALKGEPERDFIVPDHIRIEAADPVQGCPTGDEVPLITVPLKPGQRLCPEDAS